MTTPLYIVYQCYGNEGIFYECAYSLLSLSRLYTADELSNVQIWIYTDKPEWFQAFKDCPFQLHYRWMDQARIREWKGKNNFVHRVKIALLQDMCKDKTGDILYVDTDTVFTHRIDKMWQDVSGGKLYMHVAEGKVSDEANPVLKKLNKFLHSSNSPKGEDTPLYDLQMWNAGVLGFNTQHKDLLNDVMKFTDSVYPKFHKHIVEQFAFSVSFQQTDIVRAATPYILHYWNLKEARNVLADFFQHFKNSSWAELVAYSSLLQMHVLMQEKVNFLHNRSVMDKLMKKNWKPAKYNWAELMQQL